MTSTPDDQFPVGRRIRAARILAGIRSVEDLAQILATRNLGARTLRKLEDDGDDRQPQRYELRAIAEATGVPFGFFTLPADRLTAAIERADEEAGPRPGASADSADRPLASDMTGDIAALHSQVADLAEAVVALASGDAEDALLAVQAAVRRPTGESGAGADAPGRRLGAVPDDHRGSR